MPPRWTGRVGGAVGSPRSPPPRLARSPHPSCLGKLYDAGASEDPGPPDSAQERELWAASVRDLTGRRKPRMWEPRLVPPALLADVAVVLVSPKRPSSVGAVARACGCFECEDLRLVQPRCDRLQRAARNACKGSQYLLCRAAEHDDLEAALADADVSVAFTRWVKGMPAAHESVANLLASPLLAERFALNGAGSGGRDAGGRRKLALVFGREERGLHAEEVARCDAVCSIPIGRLQESLSLVVAVSLALAPLFEARLRQRGGAALADSAADLAGGVQLDLAGSLSSSSGADREAAIKLL